MPVCSYHSLRPAFEEVLPYLPKDCILSDIASVKTGLKEWYEQTGMAYVSTHPMFGPTFAVFWQIGQHLFKGRYGVFHGHGIDYQLRPEGLNLFQLLEAQAVVCEAQSSRIFLEDCHFVFKAQQVDEETSHLSCSKYKDFHCNKAHPHPLPKGGATDCRTGGFDNN